MKIKKIIGNAHKVYASFIVLAVIIFCRAVLLEQTSLIDPTEARYAVVAQEMAKTGDWVTPKLPTAEGIVPYMGKPPLHFWLTALCYEIFEVDEWTARLPSIMAALLCIYCIFLVVGKQGAGLSYEKALMSSLVLFTSAMYFFLAGASVTDTTLTACVTASIAFMYIHVFKQRTDSKYCLLSVLFAGLGFLCKGPVAIALIILPYFLWSVVNRDFSWLRKIYWIQSFFLFFLIVCPWFIVNEYYAPGSIRYFVWNENIARYLFKDYGDLYGTGHVQPYGTSWLMFFAGFAPWIFIPLAGLFKNGIRSSWQWIKSDQLRLFAFCWTIATPLFFTFVRQLHAMYVLPAFPAAALLTVEVYSSFVNKSGLLQYRQIILKALILLALVIAVSGTFLGFSWMGVALSISSIGLGLYGYYYIRDFSHSLRPIAIVSVLLASVYLTVISSLSDYISVRRSAENMLEEISQMGIKKVNVISRNSYSHYWTAGAWEEEDLAGPVEIDYSEPADIDSFSLKYLLVKKGNYDVLKKIAPRYQQIRTIGEWELFSLKA